MKSDPLKLAEQVRYALEFYATSRKAVGNLGTGEIRDVFNGEKALEALPVIDELIRQMSWQDISTAPRDGTEILCWVSDCEEHQVLWWSEHDCWKRWGDSYEYYAPTHWMPLPLAPQPDEGKL